MVGITNVPTTVHSNNKATYAEQEEINDLNKELRHLRHELRGNINYDGNKTAMMRQFLPTMD